jgi:hypothetical protein
MFLGLLKQDDSVGAASTESGLRDQEKERQFDWRMGLTGLSSYFGFVGNCSCMSGSVVYNP